MSSGRELPALALDGPLSPGCCLQAPEEDALHDTDEEEDMEFDDYYQVGWQLPGSTKFNKMEVGPGGLQLQRGGRPGNNGAMGSHARRHGRGLCTAS